MAKTVVKWDYKAAGALLLRSDEIADICNKEAERMTRETGMHYKPDVVTGRVRVHAGAKGKGRKKQ